jgi:hypothetical protein
MSRPPTGPNGGDAAHGDASRGAGFAVAKGALLIGLAVIIGIVLLQQVDNGKSSSAPAATTATTKPKTTTTVHRTAPTTTVTTAPLAPIKTPDQLRVIVLNGGAAAGTARDMSMNTLKPAGYTNQADANNWSGHTQQGNSVMCNAGLDREAAALATVVGSGSAVPVQPVPTPPPPFADGPPKVDCFVVVGAGSSTSSTTTASGQ